MEEQVMGNVEERVPSKKKAKKNLEPENTEGTLNRSYPAAPSTKGNSYLPQGSPTKPSRVSENELLPAESARSPSQLTVTTTVFGGYVGPGGNPAVESGVKFTPASIQVGPFRKTKIIDLGSPEKLGGSQSAVS
jgi:hypothetical protein